MGKSVKKNPVATDNTRSKFQKKIASKKVRQALKNSEYLLNGNLYKKVTESWDIHDYTFRLTKQEAIKNYYRWLQLDEENGFTTTKTLFPTLEDYLNWWEKNYLRK